MNKILLKNTPLLLFLFTFKFSVSHSQHQDMQTTIDKITSQGKETIVNMANAIIEEKMPSLIIRPEDYEITVWFNEIEVEVRFKRLIKYKQKDVHYRYDLTVEIGRKKIDPFDVWGNNANFFIPNQHQKETIDYLTKLMGLPARRMENEIYEDEENYHVTFYSKGGHSTHIINKKTGERLQPLDITYTVLPPNDTVASDLFSSNDQNIWKEIKE